MRSARGKEAVVLRQPEKRTDLISNARRMANEGRNNARPWEARWLELLTRIDELKETGEKLRKDVEDKCETPQLIKDQGEALRKEIQEVDRELHDRQKAKALNYVGNNEHWINVRNKLYETYSEAGKYLEDVWPEEGNPRLPAFKPQKLTVTKPKVTRKQNEKNPEETGKEDESKKEQPESVYNSVISKRTELPTDAEGLTKFLERKQFLFQKKITEIQEGKDRLTKVTHAKILQRWLDKVYEYEDVVHNTVGVEPVVDELAELLETWESLDAIVQEANVLLQPYITSPPEGQSKEKGEKVLDWFEKNEGRGQQEEDDAGKGKDERSSRQIHSDDRQRRRSPSAKSPSRQSINTFVKKSLAEDALKSVPQFNGGHEEFIDWAQAAQTLIDIKYFSATAAFQLLKKTLEGKPKKLVETMSLQEPELLETMMKKLKKEYGDAGRLAVLQRKKIADHKVVSYGADHLRVLRPRQPYSQDPPENGTCW